MGLAFYFFFFFFLFIVASIASSIDTICSFHVIHTLSNYILRICHRIDALSLGTFIIFRHVAT